MTITLLILAIVGAVFAQGDHRQTLTLSLLCAITIGSGFLDPNAFQHLWFPLLIAFEIIIAMSAIIIRSRATSMIVVFSALLVFAHASADSFLAPMANVDPYAYVVKILEVLEMLSITITSRRFVSILVKVLDKAQKVFPCQLRLKM